MLDAAVRIAEQIVDGAAALDERGAGKLKIDGAASIEHLSADGIAEVLFRAGSVELHQLALTEKRHRIVDLEARLDRVGKAAC